MTDTKIFLKKKKKQSDNMLVNVTKISQNMIKVDRLSIEKNFIKKEKKRLIIIIRKHFNLENFASL